jgi:hypothetical protein
MGVLSDIFAIPPAEVPNLSAEILPFKTYKVLDSKGIDTIKLATLRTILMGNDLNDIKAVVARQPDMILDGGEDGPWFFEISGDVVTAIATADAKQLAQTVNAWFATEEFNHLWIRADFDKWFADFTRLLVHAHNTNQRVILWMSL